MQKKIVYPNNYYQQWYYSLCKCAEIFKFEILGKFLPNYKLHCNGLENEISLLYTELDVILMAKSLVTIIVDYWGR